MFRVYRQFLEDGKIRDYYYGTYDRDTANRVAMELREGDCFSTYVIDEEELKDEHEQNY